MAAIATRIHAPTTISTAHLFIGDPAEGWFGRLSSSMLATHPPVIERVRALSPSMTEARFDAEVRDFVRSSAAEERAKVEAARRGGVWATRPAPAPYSVATPTKPPAARPDQGGDPAATPIAPLPVTLETALLTGALRGPAVAHVDTLHQRLPVTTRQQMQTVGAKAGESPEKLQGIFVGAMLASDPTQQMAQLARIAPTLGLDVARAARDLAPALAGIPSAARLPVLVALLPALVEIDSERQSKLRQVARAFAPHVAAGDWLRYAVTRILEPSLVHEHAQARALAANVPLNERGAAVGTLLLAMTQCRFGIGGGEKAYRRALVAVLPPAKWPPMSHVAVDAAALDAALATLLDLSDAATKIVVEGLVASIAETGILCASQIDLLRAVCILLDVPLPFLPVEFRIEKDSK